MLPLTFIEKDKLDEWGKDEISKLCLHFGKPQKHSWTELKEDNVTKVECNATSEPLLFRPKIAGMEETDEESEEEEEGLTPEEEDRKRKEKDALFLKPFLSEWNGLKRTVLTQNYPREKMTNLWYLIKKHHSEEFPNMIKLAHLALSSPAHTADCERGFSAQNLLLTSLRNRLSPENQDMLMRVRLHPDADLFRALLEWEKAKPRKTKT